MHHHAPDLGVPAVLPDLLPHVGVCTAGSVGMTLFAQAQAATSGAPWWTPLACALVMALPPVLAFIDRRLAAREARRVIATAAGVAASVPPAPAPPTPPV